MASLNKIIEGLEEMRSRGNSNLCVDPENRWCLTFEVRDSTTKGPPFWLQVQAGTLNMQYLDDDDPVDRLRKEVSSFPSDFTLIAWEPTLYATFEMSRQYSTDLAVLLDRIAQEYFALQPQYDLCYQLEDHR